jgi:hypothetical protein
MVIRVLAVAVAMLAWASVARGQPAAAVSDTLREANTAALAGDWPRVSELVGPLLDQSLARTDLAEAHRLVGIAAFFQQHREQAESHFVNYLRIEVDGRLDPALYPPDVIAFFNDVASRHAVELRAMRRQPKQRWWWLTLLPPFGQLQNGDRGKAYAIGGAFAASLTVNLVTYGYLRAWCSHNDGSAGGALTCNDGGDHTAAARALRPWNIGSGIALIAIYAYGVYDAIAGYRRVSRERSLQPFVAGSGTSVVVGVTRGF